MPISGFQRFTGAFEHRVHGANGVLPVAGAAADRAAVEPQRTLCRLDHLEQRHLGRVVAQAVAALLARQRDDEVAADQ